MPKWATTSKEMRQFPETFYLCSSTELPLEVSTCIHSAFAYVRRQESLNGSVYLHGNIPFLSLLSLATNGHCGKDVPGDRLETKKDILTPNSVNSNVQFSKFSAGWRWEYSKGRGIPGYHWFPEMKSSPSVAMNSNCSIPYLSPIGLCLQGKVFITVERNVTLRRGSDNLIQSHALPNQLCTFFFLG